jgi:archaemetzincin
LNDVERDVLEKIGEGLKTTYNMISEIVEPIKIPDTALVKFRNQYQSNVLLDFLEKGFQGRILGVTKEDVYTEGLNFIFGQAKMKGRVALLSISRLNPKFFNQNEDKTLFEDRYTKESIHEIGHVLGLEHCPTRGCVMNFSNTIGEVDKKTKYLCDNCKKSLKS